MQKSSFFNSVNGDRRYKAEEWAEYFGSFIGNGVFSQPATNLMVQANTNMTVVVKAGKAWINGYFFHNTKDATFHLDTADGVLERIDRIVVRWSLTHRSITLALKKGVNASSPTYPMLQRDADIYELVLADVTVGNGVVEILQTNITDRRMNSELCGIVTQTVQTIDTSQLAAQLQAWFTEYQRRSDKEYQQLLGFFESLKTQGDAEFIALQAWFAEYQQRSTKDYQQLIDFFESSKIQGNAEFIALQAWFADYKAHANSDFTTWFNELNNTLDENAETHILNLINALTAKVTMIENVIFNDINTNPYLIMFDDLEGILAGGVWNESLKLLEC